VEGLKLNHWVKANTEESWGFLMLRMAGIFALFLFLKVWHQNTGAEPRPLKSNQTEHGRNMPVRVTSKEGIALIKKFEGCELTAYQDSVGVWTIGYGHTKNVCEGDCITMGEADRMLEEELVEYEGYINDMVKVDLSQNQFDALVAWVYNLGPTNLSQSSLLRELNNGNIAKVPSEMRRWNKAGGRVLDGLIRRREAEALLFLGEDWYEV